jgi:pimeloyl-ACP methyl ester carboxylesterase
MDALAIDRGAGRFLQRRPAIAGCGEHAPARVSVLVLISSRAFLGDKPAAAEIWRAVSCFEGGVDRRFVEDFVRDTSPESVADDVVDTLVEESLKVPAHVWNQTLRGLIDVDVRATLAGITAPTLLIAGDQDVFAGADQQVLSGAIPVSRLDLYEGPGHGVISGPSASLTTSPRFFPRSPAPAD